MGVKAPNVMYIYAHLAFKGNLGHVGSFHLKLGFCVQLNPGISLEGVVDRGFPLEEYL